METFSALLAICAGNSPVTGEFPAQTPVTRSFDVFFGLRLNYKQLSKQSWAWWFETPSHPFWRHCNKKASNAESISMAWRLHDMTNHRRALMTSTWTEKTYVPDVALPRKYARTTIGFQEVTSGGGYSLDIFLSSTFHIFAEITK